MAKGAGLPNPGKPAFLVIGKLTRPHGIRGEMVMEITTDFPERLKPGVEVYFGEEYKPLIIQSIRNHARGLIIAFTNYYDPDAVGVLRNQILYTRVKDLPSLPEGDYYHHELIGLKVRTQERELGELTEIIQTGANDVFIVQTDSKLEILIPYVDEIVQKIDLAGGEILIDPIPGLLPESID